jgi:hypothetical protein
MTELVWRSDNGLWTIQRRNGEYTLTDGRPGCTVYTIDERYIAHTRHLLTLAKTHRIPTPAYVCRAILRYCPRV